MNMWQKINPDNSNGAQLPDLVNLGLPTLSEASLPPINILL